MTERIHVNMREAKARLCELAERVLHGEEVLFFKNGKPYLNLLPHIAEPRVRKPGRLKGSIRVSANFEKTSGKIIDGFEGSR